VGSGAQIGLPLLSLSSFAPQRSQYAARP